MARTHARIFTVIWSDADFLALSEAAQRMFLFLVSQPDLEHSGVIALREKRWSRGSRESTLDSVRKALGELVEHGFVVIDEDTEELLVRSFMRWDGVWKQPNIAKAAASHIRTLTSVPILTAIFSELARIDVGSGNADLKTLHASLSGEVRSVLPATPENPSANPSAKGSEMGSANPSLRGRGRGEGDGTTGSTTGFPFPPSPSTSPSPAASPASADPAAPVPAGATAEGEGDLDLLIAEIREIRPDWASASIRRALADPRVAERPAALVRIAALAMAADPASDHPGRLPADGPWWRVRTVRTTQPRPPWCRDCDPETRLTVTDPPGRCPACHPLTQPPREDT